MTAFNKFQPWVEYLTEGVNTGTDSFVVALTNSAPSAANGVLSDITQITYTNLSSRALTTASSAQTGGVQTVDFNDIVLTASGGSVGPFRYLVIYDDTVASDPLVGWYDYESAITLADGEALTVTFAGTGCFTVA
jgi:hypothetical protein